LNPHSVLGVASDATPEQVKAAYRKLAMKHHPDKGGDIAEFQKIQEAYDAINKPKAQQNQQREQEHPFRRSGFAWHFAQGGSPEDFWGGPRERRNTDYTMQAAITLEQAYEGTQLSITINDRVITINVPRGVQHGQRLSVQSEGSREHADLPPGHLHIVIGIRQHPVFQSNGPDLLTVKDVDVLDMLMGCEIEITGLSGDKIKVTVPVNSKPSTRLRIPGKGMPIQHSDTDAHGALFIVLNPMFPNLSPEEIDRLNKVRA
jgi:DnaJ-class molecular chaperone